MAQGRAPDMSMMSESYHPESLLEAGDWVTTGANVAPFYRVIAVCGDKAWIRDAASGHDGITSLHRCHRVDGPEASMVRPN